MVAAQLVEEEEPILRPDVDVEEHESDIAPGQRLACGAQRRGLEHAVPVELEVDTAEEPDRRSVVDDQHGVRITHLAGRV
jgi:hypothetical protein